MTDIGPLQGFFDDSFSPGEVLILAGFVAREEQWAAFSAAWQERLEQAQLGEFKMSQLSSWPPEKIGYFYRLIEQHTIMMACVALPIEELRAAAEKVGIAFPGTPQLYGYAQFLLMDLLAAGMAEPIQVFFDRQESTEKHLDEAWAFYDSRLSDEKRQIIGSRMIHLDSQDSPPLQAADLAAWWYRKRWKRDGDFSEESFPFPWPTKVDYGRVLCCPTRDWLETDLSEMLLYHTIKNWNLSATFTNAKNLDR